MEKFNYDNSRIAVIDDEEEILITYKSALERKGMWVITFNNPVEALEWLETNDVDVILLDYYMPEKNGNQFVEEYKGNAITILQTGYSDELPADEMIDSLNIQGYFNKNKGFEELILSVKSAIKTASLYKKVNMLNYEKEFISNLLVNVTDETKDQVMAISGQRYLIEDEASKLNNDVLKDAAKSIEKSLEKINHTFKSLNFAGQEIASNLSAIFDTVKTLTKAKSSVLFNIENESDKLIPIDCKGSTLVYILSEIVMYLYANKVEQAEIIGRLVDGKINILIDYPYHYSNEIIEKIKNIANQGKNISINISEINILEIEVEII